ncbi:MAG: response regulator transcription factor [Alphaproteobacteria bacterium]|nr:response regulator transcription factor [Alphaproteobacteria bacterium]MCB9974064.1 response regulator transcription factor [Rhodospirillales bacterium]
MKLLIADDHTLFRDTLVQYIERASPDSQIVLARDFFEARDALNKGADFELIILDFRMPGMNGFEGLEYVRENFPDKPVAIMSGVAEKEDVRKALDMGAKGYFPKTMSGKSLIGAIQEVLKGNLFVPFDSETKDYMPAYYNDPNTVDGKAQEADNSRSAEESLKSLGLTPREREIVHFLAAGSANKDIALALDLQVVTVKLHVRSICRKLDAKNRTQAALKLRDYGIRAVGSQETDAK